MANFDTLKALIAAKIHDNTEQEITAEDVRDSFNSTIDAVNTAKQDTISNLATIEADAAAGATAVQPGDLASVATSGSYADLLNKPTIPAAPGTLNTDNSSAQTAQSSEALSGTIKLHKVSKTGSYDDLLNKPTIPAAQVNSDWNAASGVAQILNKPTIPAAPGTLDTTATTAQATSSSEALSGSVKLHKISKTGKYSDLSGKPTVPVITLNGSTAGNPSFYAPTTAGTQGQVLTSNGSGAPTWQNAPSGGVQDVTVGGTSVVSGGVAAVPAIPAAPGTLDTDNAAAQSVNASEALSGTVKLHKVAKTGTYSDLIGTPTIPTVPTISTDIDTDQASDTKTASPKAVYDYVGNPIVSLAVPTPNDGTVVFTHLNGDTTTMDLNHVHLQYYAKAAQSSQPVGGFLPDEVYVLGELSGSVTFALASAVSGNVNHYFWTFETGASAPTVTWPAGITWADGNTPAPGVNKHCEVSILGGVGIYMEA